MKPQPCQIGFRDWTEKETGVGNEASDDHRAPKFNLVYVWQAEQQGYCARYGDVEHAQFFPRKKHTFGDSSQRWGGAIGGEFGNQRGSLTGAAKGFRFEFGFESWVTIGNFSAHADLIRFAVSKFFDFIAGQSIVSIGVERAKDSRGRIDFLE